MQNKEKENQMGNSRVLKFRAWNKDWKMMAQPENILSIHFDGVTNCAVDVDFWIETTDGQRHKNTWEDSEDIILMQYTGLKDKNGKEIYEGDVVKREEENPCLVEIGDGMITAGGVWLNEFRASLEEAIGNIHENPELLTK